MKGVSALVWIGLAGVASIAMFHIKFEVEQLQGALNGLNKEILQEQKAVHVLQAEWSYLTRPEHIEALADRLLPHLQPAAAHQVGDIEQFQTAIQKPRTIPAATTVRPASARELQ
ncbi:MAG: hypothetical protein OXT06_17445 [Rhodospirillaceae bacterium]|nr:hypothetical protein [Rhodospirillaceae bacterium]MDD9918771.1 hypothetical protein [Rhodospirillaceae bacterium]